MTAAETRRRPPRQAALSKSHQHGDDTASVAPGSRSWFARHVADGHSRQLSFLEELTVSTATTCALCGTVAAVSPCPDCGGGER